MKKHLASAAAIAALATPLAAHAETPGYVDLSFGQWTSSGNDVDTTTLGGSGAVDLTGNWRAQFDGEALRLSSGGDGFTLNSLAAHAYYDGGEWAFGGVLSSNDFGEGAAWTLGAEGQMDVGAFVVEGEVGFGTIEGFGSDADTRHANVSATWYATPNFSVAAGYDYSDIEQDFNDTVLHLDGEYKFDNSPFSLIAGYASHDSEFIDFDTWQVGLRYGFGDDTLRDRRQNGPRWLRGSSSLLPIA